MELVTGIPLADRPDFTSVLRCRYKEGQQFPFPFIWQVCTDVASACSYLHSVGICHGGITYVCMYV